MASYILTGEGAGKTTAAFGLALRAAGWGKRVVVVQFMKGLETGELLACRKLGIEVKQFGKKEFVDLKNPSEEDKLLAKKALEFAKKQLNTKIFLLILDEINIAAHFGLLNLEDVLALIKLAKTKNIHLMLTGRYAQKELMELADFVNEIKVVKAMKELKAVKGIQY